MGHDNLINVRYNSECDFKIDKSRINWFSGNPGNPGAGFLILYQKEDLNFDFEYCAGNLNHKFRISMPYKLDSLNNRNYILDFDEEIKKGEISFKNLDELFDAENSDYKDIISYFYNASNNRNSDNNHLDIIIVPKDFDGIVAKKIILSNYLSHRLTNNIEDLMKI